ncbi:MAG: hypothetical protein ABIJ46_04120 [bacterium]
MRNKTFGLLTAGAMVAQLLIPATGSAARAENAANGTAGQAPVREARALQVGICSNIDAVGVRMLSRTVEQAERFAERRTQRNGRLDAYRAGRETGLAQARSEQGQRHERRFEMMLERAGDNEDLAEAVMEFRDGVEAALADRQAAVDAAIEAYTDSLDQAIAERREASDAAVAELRSAVTAAVDAAKADCAAGQDGVQVRQSLNDAVKAAHDQFISDWREIRSLNDEVQQLVEERNEAFRAAWVEFKVQVEQVSADFKARLQELRSEESDDSVDEADGADGTGEADVTAGEEQVE